MHWATVYKYYTQYKICFYVNTQKNTRNITGKIKIYIDTRKHRDGK